MENKEQPELDFENMDEQIRNVILTERIGLRTLEISLTDGLLLQFPKELRGVMIQKIRGDIRKWTTRTIKRLNDKKYQEALKILHERAEK